MERRYFSRDVALAKLRTRIRSQIRFTGVPIGTYGRVIAVNEVYCERYSLAIQWDLSERQCGLAWLNRNEYEHFLVELSPVIH